MVRWRHENRSSTQGENNVETTKSREALQRVRGANRKLLVEIGLVQLLMTFVMGVTIAYAANLLAGRTVIVGPAWFAGINMLLFAVIWLALVAIEQAKRLEWGARPSKHTGYAIAAVIPWPMMLIEVLLYL